MPEFERDGVRLYFATAGDPGLPPAVLLHGFGSEHRAWHPVVEALAGEYFVITPDLRGHGFSGAPEDLADYGIDNYAADLFALLDHLQLELAAVVGCSFGGMIALHAAVDRPDRVAALCATDTSPAYEHDSYGEEFRERERGIDLTEAFVREHGYAAVGKREAAHVADPFLAAGVRARYRRMPTEGWLGAAHTRRSRPDLSGRLHERLTMPVLLCTGDADPVRSAFDLMAAALPHARAVTFRNCGHGVPFLIPDAFSDVLREFLLDVEEGRPADGRRTV